MFTIARHELYATFRRRQREGEIFDPKSLSVIDLGMSPSTAIGRKEEQRLMLTAMYRLPLDLQVVLELFYWEEMSSDELAAVLEIPVGTVKSRLRRAKEALRGHMAEIARTAAVLESSRENFDDWVASIRDCFGDI